MARVVAARMVRGADRRPVEGAKRSKLQHAQAADCKNWLPNDLLINSTVA